MSSHTHSCLQLPCAIAGRPRRPASLIQRAVAALCCSFGLLGIAAAASVVQPLVVGDPGGASQPAGRNPDSPLPADLEDSLRAQLESLALNSSQQALPGVNRVEIEVGRLDPRLKLAPCERVEPYLPTATRLWGKARIGLRCTAGPSQWNVYLPITVKVYGPAWVASTTLTAGSTIGPADLVQGEIDFAEETAPVVVDPEQAIGRELSRRVAAGQGLRTTDIRPRQWFAAGDMVKVVAQGRGFSISGSGKALAHGVEGRTIRVRTDAGKIVSGLATGDRLVEIQP